MRSELALIERFDPVLVREVVRRRRPLVLAFVIIALAALAAAQAWPSTYVSSTTILVKERSIITPLMEGRAVPTGVADLAGIAREVIFGRRVLEEALAVGGWLDGNPGPVERDRLMDQIRNRITIISPRENLIQIDYRDADAARAYRVTRRIADLFIALTIESKERESRDAFTFIDSQVEAYRKKLSEAEDNLKRYRAGNDDARPGSEADANARIAQLRSQAESARIDLIEQRSREQALQGQLSGQSTLLSVQTREADYYHRLADLQAELDKLLLSYTPNHPDVVRVRHQMQDLQSELEREKQRQPAESASAKNDLGPNLRYNPLYQELQSRLSETRRNAAAASSRMSSSEALLQHELDRSRHIADLGDTLAELNRDYEVHRDIYQDLLKRRENARLSMQMDAEQRGLTLTIQTPAQLPLRPVGPRFFVFAAIGLSLGVVIPLALMFGFLRVDPRVRSAEQIERVAGVPVLASVALYRSPAERGHQRHRDWRLVMLIGAVLLTYVGALALRLLVAS